MVAHSKWLTRLFEDLTQQSWTPLSKADVNTPTALAIADSFEQGAHSPHCPKTQAAYQAFCRETARQFTTLLNSGMSIVPWVHPGQPYRNSREMSVDVNIHRRISFFRTASGHGKPEELLDQTSNPLLQDAGFQLDGLPLCYNDLFRAVHDVFGHALESNNFSARGEENAWRSHLTMYSTLAAAAMTTETRGQNCWVNFGPHMRGEVNGELLREDDEGWLPAKTRPYAAQKMLCLPERFCRVE